MSVFSINHYSDLMSAIYIVSSKKATLNLKLSNANSKVRHVCAYDIFSCPIAYDCLENWQTINKNLKDSINKLTNAEEYLSVVYESYKASDTTNSETI